MPKYVVEYRQGGGSLVLEGVGLGSIHKEGSDVALIYITGENNRRLAYLPADAVQAVYQSDAEVEEGDE